MRYCPLCNNANNHILTPLNYAMFDDLGLSGQMHLVSCKECCFIFNQTSLGEADFSEYYRRNEYYLDTKTSGSGGASEQDFTRYSRIFNELQSVLPKKDRLAILDYGCGKGGMLAWLSQNVNAELIGIEPSESCRKYAQVVLSARMFQSLDQFKGKADIVILSHVLEHILNPRSFLGELSGYCKDNALLYIEVPRAESYLYEKVDWRELYFEHINHFTENSLETMVAATGFDILNHGVVNFFEEDPQSPACIFMLARPGKIPGEVTRPRSCEKIRIEAPPASKIISEVLIAKKKISVWGISQYTQLILGTYPELMNRVVFLFDSSPAKIGRRLGGVKIIFSKELSVLGKEDVLLIPGAKYANEMRAYLRQINFMGTSVCY